MTMPYGSAEEPEIEVHERQSVPVHVASSSAKPGKSIGTEHGYWRTFLISNTVQLQGVATPGAVRIANRSLRRHRLIIKVNSGGVIPLATTNVPAIATSGTAVQNPNPNPVNVTLAGFTATQVFVNGILVGAGNGTYAVPAFGSISVTFTVLGTTTTVPIVTTQAQNPLDGVIIGSREFISNSAQILNPYAAGLGAGFLQVGDNVRWECQQELWAAFPPNNSGPVLVTTSDEVYASDPESYKAEQ